MLKDKMKFTRSPFSIRLRADLLEDLKLVSRHRPVTMTGVIEKALESYLPTILSDIQEDLDRRVQGAGEQ